MSKGFTIIELIISIFILSVAVVGVFSAFSIVIILTSGSADRLTGTYLAQEGMEIVRNIRDTNWLKMDFCASNPSDSECTTPPTWVDGLASTGVNNSVDCSSTSSATGCEADYTTGTGGSGAFSMSPWASRPLYINNTNGFYNYTNGTNTKFKRKITITPTADVNNQPNDHIIKVKVQVFWDEKPNILDSNPSSNPDKYSITAEETLYDWYNYAHQ